MHAVYGADSHGLATRPEVETIVMLDCRSNVFVCVYSVSINKVKQQCGWKLCTFSVLRLLACSGMET